MKIIESEKNLFYRTLLSLLNAKGIKKHNQFLLSGEKIIKEVLLLDKIKIHSVLSSPKHQKKDFFDAFSQIQISNNLFKSLDVLNTNYPIFLCEAPKINQTKLNESPSGLELLLPLGDPRNLGSCMRSARAFNFKNISLLEESAHPFLPKTIKASSGAVFHLNLNQGPSIKKINPLSTENIFALDSRGENIKSIQFPKNFRLIIGEEGSGLPSHLNVKFVSIPIASEVESLNASVATALALQYINDTQPIHSK